MANGNYLENTIKKNKLDIEKFDYYMFTCIIVIIESVKLFL